jgi:anti-sigma B factor antagonist
MLRMTERPVGDVMILDLHGTLSPGVAEVNLGDKVRSILYSGYRKLLLNLANMTSTDSSAVSALVGALLAAREVRAEIKLVNVMTRLKDVLIIAALHSYFTIFDSEDDALESFRPTGQAQAV